MSSISCMQSGHKFVVFEQDIDQLIEGVMFSSFKLYV